jgi:hypothetical protein
LSAPPQHTLGATTPDVLGPELSAANDARFRALRQAVLTTPPDAARLYADFAKAGVATPREVRTLLEMKDRGTSHDDLVAYVRTSFPNDVITRGIALRWLGAGTRTHLPSQTNPPPALGELVKRGAE